MSKCSDPKCGLCADSRSRTNAYGYTVEQWSGKALPKMTVGDRRRVIRLNLRPWRP